MVHAVPARIAIPVGDPNGIGPEIAIRTALHYAGRYDVRLTVFGPCAALLRAAEGMGMHSIPETVAWTDTPFDADCLPGHIVAPAGEAMVAAASQAIEATRAGQFDAVVAGPHHETAVHLAGIAFSGYPSLLARVCGHDPESVFMLLVGGGLRIVHVTLHESVQHALQRLRPELVVQATLAGQRALQRMGIPKPSIALFGINPHASENGLFGDEDLRTTVPAAERLRAMGLSIDGPAGADLLLSERRHDLYVAIFHDQGHIPIKLICPRGASALSIGSDVILSSVGHGCAMDIAGQGRADPRAMIEAVARLARIPSDLAAS